MSFELEDGSPKMEEGLVSPRAVRPTENDSSLLKTHHSKLKT